MLFCFVLASGAVLPSNSIVIFTDGACSGNPGSGGWGTIISKPDGTVHEMGGSAPQTTNNRMEMAAAIRGLAAIESAPEEIIIYTDSTYLIKGITQWIWGWRSRGWKTAEGKDVANRELWEELSHQIGRLKPVKIDWKYVRGHDGNPGNERCDAIAVAFSKGKREPLYSGNVDGYFVDLTEVPQEADLPERSSSAPKNNPGGGQSAPGVTTYLSYINGVVTRHTSWADCERQVKGKPNVKFKKAKSPQEEKEILVSWGLAPSTHIE